ncbi:lytic transglycosylase domain-containing protein [Telmatospirillum siberiense]|uniref:Murein transglycosylase n=1 Tax=Telmatospirillum siberiense TaxID=382514 RepID=A0A2N3PLS4_9PROT|nr:lytic transglycosylase domain-containing protein [Telmatospirillum siberiense]PKU21350.1 murein transglycosylase [Telmatospirillum siberiense]
MKEWFAIGLVAAALCLGATPVRADLLSADDEKLYHEAFNAARNDHYDWAQAAAAKAHSKLLAKVLQWQYYTQANSGAGFAEITAFIRANPTWPQISTLQRRAEEVITAATPDSVILDWFSTSAPQTVDGAMAYGRALINAGQNEKALKLLRDTWVGGNFGPIQERQFLDTFQEILRDEEDDARFDRLLWTHQEQAAARQLSRVDDSFRLLAQARLALDNDEANAEALAARLPERFKNDPGLLYELVHYRRQHDKDDQAIALLSHPAADTVHPEMWWTERAVLARRALAQGRISQAYEIARRHGQMDGAGFADAEWFSGWIALRFLSDYEVALGHFTRMFERVSSAQSRSRAAYWAGRASDALGRGDDSVRWYNLAAVHITTFYGQLAAGRLNRDQLWPLPADPEPTAADHENFERHELVRVARMLGQIKETDLIRPFMMRMAELSDSPGTRTLAAGLASTLGRSDIAVSVAKRSEREGVPIVTSGYPVPRLNTADRPERALVFGVIRQESAFYHQAVSPAGARGLMQLMPTTAAKIAKAMNVVFKKKEALANALTQDPGLNVKLGSAYLEDLLADFNGSYILSVASYNAGPSRVRKWMRDLGDPRQPDVDAVDWIESIPFAETRNYVQRVLEGVQVYRRRLGVTDPTLSLERDVKR